MHSNRVYMPRRHCIRSSSLGISGLRDLIKHPPFKELTPHVNANTFQSAGMQTWQHSTVPPTFNTAQQHCKSYALNAEFSFNHRMWYLHTRSQLDFYPSTRALLGA